MSYRHVCQQKCFYFTEFSFIIFYLFIFVRKTTLNELDMKLEMKSICVDLCTYLTCNLIYFFKVS